MNFKQYTEQVRNDAIEHIDFEVECGRWTKDTNFDDVYEELFTADGVTGNGSGSYTFNRFKAQENIADAIFDDEIISAFEGAGTSLYDLLKNDDPEGIDVIIRCHVLSNLYGELEDYFWDLTDDDEENE